MTQPHSVTIVERCDDNVMMSLRYSVRNVTILQSDQMTIL